MIESFFFGNAMPLLFGSYHAPAGPHRHRAVLLIPALGHEYVQCHFAYKTLAVRLADVGFPVLRFDFRGVGNAEGAFQEATIADWLTDIERAIEELAELSRAASVCVAGIRLGATLAALVAGACPAVDAVLLWNPVLDGPRYLVEIKARQAAFLRTLPGRAKPAAKGDGMEILGFCLGATLVHELEQIDGPHLGRCLASKQVLLLEDGDPIPDAARQAIGVGCARFASLGGVAGEPWLHDPHQVFLPGKAVGEIAAWMTSLC